MKNFILGGLLGLALTFTIFLTLYLRWGHL